MWEQLLKNKAEPKPRAAATPLSKKDSLPASSETAPRVKLYPASPRPLPYHSHTWPDRGHSDARPRQTGSPAVLSALTRPRNARNDSSPPPPPSLPPLSPVPSSLLPACLSSFLNKISL